MNVRGRAWGESHGILSFGHEMAIALRIHGSYGYLDKTYTGSGQSTFQPAELIRLRGLLKKTKK